MQIPEETSIHSLSNEIHMRLSLLQTTDDKEDQCLLHFNLARAYQKRAFFTNRTDSLRDDDYKMAIKNFYNARQRTNDPSMEFLFLKYQGHTHLEHGKLSTRSPEEKESDYSLASFIWNKAIELPLDMDERREIRENINTAERILLEERRKNNRNRTLSSKRVAPDEPQQSTSTTSTYSTTSLWWRKPEIDENSTLSTPQEKFDAHISSAREHFDLGSSEKMENSSREIFLTNAIDEFNQAKRLAYDSDTLRVSSGCLGLAYTARADIQSRSFSDRKEDTLNAIRSYDEYIRRTPRKKQGYPLSLRSDAFMDLVKITCEPKYYTNAISDCEEAQSLGLEPNQQHKVRKCLIIAYTLRGGFNENLSDFASAVKKSKDMSPEELDEVRQYINLAKYELEQAQNRQQRAPRMKARPLLSRIPRFNPITEESPRQSGSRSSSSTSYVSAVGDLNLGR